MGDAVGTAAVAALATLAFSAAVVSNPAPVEAAQGATKAQPAGDYGWDYVVPAAPGIWVWREVYDAEGALLGRERVNLLG